jgi:hypothetical protein
MSIEKLAFVAFTLWRVESKTELVYPVQPVGVSRCCCIGWMVRQNVILVSPYCFTLFYGAILSSVLFLQSCYSCNPVLPDCLV